MLTALPGLLKSFLLPPMGLLVLAVVALSLRGQWERFGRRLCMVSLALIYAMSTPLVANSLLRAIQEKNVTSKDAQAIVILSAGVARDLDVSSGWTADAFTLERLRYGASLQHRTALPVLVTGGRIKHGSVAIAQVMSEILESDFHITPKWQELESRNTAENASKSAPLLRAAGIRHIYLVTHAWHMARARMAFEHEGLTVTAAGTGYCPENGFVPTDLLPSLKSLNESYYAIHEITGIATYYVRLSRSVLL